MASVVHRFSYAGRNALPTTLRSRFVEVQVPDFTVEEITTILTKRVDVTPAGMLLGTCTIPSDIAAILARVYCRLKDSMYFHPTMSMRECVKWQRRAGCLASHTLVGKRLWALAGWGLLASRMDGERGADQLATIFKEEFDVPAEFTLVDDVPIEWTSKEVVFRQGATELRFDAGPCAGRVARVLVNLQASPLFVWNGGKISMPPLSFQRALVKIVHAVHAREPVLLVGPPCYKSLLVETWSRIFGAHDSLLPVYLTPETESQDLVGQMQPFGLRGSLLEVVSLAEQLLRRVKAMHSTLWRSPGEVEEVRGTSELGRRVAEMRRAVEEGMSIAKSRSEAAAGVPLAREAFVQQSMSAVYARELHGAGMASDRAQVREVDADASVVGRGDDTDDGDDGDDGSIIDDGDDGDDGSIIDDGDSGDGHRESDIELEADDAPPAAGSTSDAGPRSFGVGVEVHDPPVDDAAVDPSYVGPSDWSGTGSALSSVVMDAACALLTAVDAIVAECKVTFAPHDDGTLRQLAVTIQRTWSSISGNPSGDQSMWV
jgi:hypothetical protein